MFSAFLDIIGVVHSFSCLLVSPLSLCAVLDLCKTEGKYSMSPPGLALSLLQHDNAMRHTSARTTSVITALFSLSWTTHHCTSQTWLHMTSSLPETEEDLRGHHLLPDDDVKILVKMWFRQQDAQFCRNGLIKLSERWWKF
jgi:hypothetical protein